MQGAHWAADYDLGQNAYFKLRPSRLKFGVCFAFSAEKKQKKFPGSARPKDNLFRLSRLKNNVFGFARPNHDMFRPSRPNTHMFQLSINMNHPKLIVIFE